MSESPALFPAAQLPHRALDTGGSRPAPSLGAAKAAIGAAISPTVVENVALEDAGGRILAEDVRAAVEYWPFPRAAMDGVAVRAGDVAKASPNAPTRLPVLAAAFCGDAPQMLPHGPAAIRIATGAAIPAGCDAVIPQEVLEFDDADVLVRRPIPAGRHIFPAGEDMHAGERVLRAGTRLQGGQIGLLAALGCATVPVHRRPRVAIVASGDELLEPGTRLTPGHVFDSNSYALLTELRALGCESRRIGIADDDPPRLLALLETALDGTDALITCGGLSVGERDYIRPALRALGARFVFEGVPMKPGHPFAFALYEARLVFALPGTPGACRVAFEFFVRPALCALQGDTEAPTATAVRLASSVRSRPGRTRLLWARLRHGTAGLVAEPLGDQSSATLRSAADAHALLRIEPHENDLLAGTEVPALILTPERIPSRHRSLAAVLGVVGARNAGKTTLIERLIPAFGARGVRVAVVKHHGHFAELDEQGKDTARAAAAGAVTTVLVGPAGTVTRTRASGTPSLEAILASLNGIDLVLVEGYADAGLPKVRVERPGCCSDRSAASGPFLALVGSGSSEDAPRFAADAVDPLVDYLGARLFGARFSAKKGDLAS